MPLKGTYGVCEMNCYLEAPCLGKKRKEKKENVSSVSVNVCVALPPVLPIVFQEDVGRRRRRHAVAIVSRCRLRRNVPTFFSLIFMREKNIPSPRPPYFPPLTPLIKTRSVFFSVYCTIKAFSFHFTPPPPPIFPCTLPPPLFLLCNSLMCFSPAA